MTLFDRVFGGSDYNFARTVTAVDEAIAKFGEAEPVAFPNTAYNIPCYSPSPARRSTLWAN